MRFAGRTAKWAALARTQILTKAHSSVLDALGERGSGAGATQGGWAKAGLSMADSVVEQLAGTIRSRRHAAGDKSYTRQLLDAGPERCARKFGEEALETVIAALGTDKQALTSEAADVIYHLLVLLEARGVAWADVAAVLASRSGTSGLDEKAARSRTAS